MKYNKAFILLMICCLSLCYSEVEAQRKRCKKAVSKVSKAKQKKAPKIISAGVINGRAIDLVIPEFPKAAISLNLYGQVTVEVLIEVNNGKTISAKAVSGNPVFYANSTKAALQSTFEPMILGSEPVRVSGFIHYHFIPNEWNWLEVGYVLGSARSSYYSFNNLKNTIPTNFPDEIQTLHQNTENSDEIRQLLIASIQNKLGNDPKNFWLFEVGLNLAISTTKWNSYKYSIDVNSYSFQELKSLVSYPPTEIKFVLFKKDPRIYCCHRAK